MNGRIEIQTIHSVGTTVDIFIPCESDKDTELIVTAMPIAAAPTIGQLDIFIVEDDRMNRLVLEKILKNQANLPWQLTETKPLRLLVNATKRAIFFR